MHISDDLKVNYWIDLFNRVILDYHHADNVDTPLNNPFANDTLDHLLYKKNWIDTVQWHLEDIIRDPLIQPEQALSIKRRIDASNQERTDMVEYIDSFFLNYFKDTNIADTAVMRTESPAWAIDRLSILALKIYHMQQETQRTEASSEHLKACQSKLNVLLQQQQDLADAIQTLLNDIAAGTVYMKAYKQMKMYNDPSLNPVLYAKS